MIILTSPKSNCRLLLGWFGWHRVHRNFRDEEVCTACYLRGFAWLFINFQWGYNHKSALSLEEMIRLSFGDKNDSSSIP